MSIPKDTQEIKPAGTNLKAFKVIFAILIVLFIGLTVVLVHIIGGQIQQKNRDVNNLAHRPPGRGVSEETATKTSILRAMYIAEHGTPKGSYVASKSGTRYYAPWCGGASRIKQENRVWFKSEEQAQARGLSLAKGCTP